MAITNRQVEVLRKTSSGHGHFGKTSIGVFDVWYEGMETRELRDSVGAVTNRDKVPSGLLFFFDDLDLSDCFVKIDDAVFPVVAFDKFYDRNGSFHHIEATFSR